MLIIAGTFLVAIPMISLLMVLITNYFKSEPKEPKHISIRWH